MEAAEAVVMVVVGARAHLPLVVEEEEDRAEDGAEGEEGLQEPQQRLEVDDGDGMR